MIKISTLWNTNNLKRIFKSIVFQHALAQSRLAIEFTTFLTENPLKP